MYFLFRAIAGHLPSPSAVRQVALTSLAALSIVFAIESISPPAFLSAAFEAYISFLRVFHFLFSMLFQLVFSGFSFFQKVVL